MGKSAPGQWQEGAVGVPEGAAPRVAAPVLRRAVIGASIGNLVEWFDFAVYGYLAPTLGAVFFPSDDPTVSLLASFAAFGAAFFARPLGGLVFGALGDRVGRQRTLATVIRGEVRDRWLRAKGVPASERRKLAVDAVRRDLESK